MDGVHLMAVGTGGRLLVARRAWRLFVVLVVALTTATAGVVTASWALAAPVAQGTVNAGSFTVSAGSVEDPGPVGTTNTIVATAPRTILDFTSFHLAAGDELRISVSDNSHIVQIRVPAAAATVDGELVSTIGPAVHSNPADPSSPITNIGGNVWLLSGTGVLFGSTAQVDVGGLLAFTGTIADADFTDGDLTFGLGGAPGFGTLVQVDGASASSGAVIRGHGGLVALVSRSVGTVFGSQIGSAPGSRSELLLGGTRSATMTLQARPGDGHFDLLRFEPLGATLNGSVAAFGDVAAADVFVSSTATTNATNQSTTYTRNATANGHAADGDGDYVMSAGGGLGRTSLSAPPQPLIGPAAPKPFATTMGTTRANRSLVVAGSDNVDLSYGTLLDAPTVAVSARGTLRNFEGASAISPTTGQWVLYAPTPADVDHVNANSTNPDVNGTLNSGQRAVWGGTLETHPPSSLSGKRYVFSNPPDITVTADNKAKDFDTAFAAGQPTELTATVSGTLHPGIPNLFLGDTGTLYTGSSALTSTGAPHTAPERPGDYPIVPSLGSLSSPVGYEFVFVNGTLTVDDTSPPTVTPTVTGTRNAAGWYRGDVELSWSIVDPGTVSTSITGDAGCAPRTITADQEETTYTCTGTSLGGTAEPVSVTIKRDGTAPELTITGVSDGETYVPGSWTNAPVSITYSCDAPISGVADQPDDTVAEITGAYGGTCTDNAGNTHTVPFQVNIDQTPPTIPSVWFTLENSGGEYTPGTWASEPVRYHWTCDDEGGSGPSNGGASGPTSVSLTFRAICEDRAGNSTTGDAHEILIDGAAPTIVSPTLTSGGNAYTEGAWTRTPVTLTWGCADTGGSEPTPAGGTESRSTSGTLTATCTDAAGNEVSQEFTVAIDGTAPAIGGVELETADGAAYTSGDWTQQDVVLSWTCTDGDGQSGAATVSDSVTATSTGALRAVCSDVAGNVVQSEPFQANIDRTDPTIIEPTLTSGGASYTEGSWARGPVTLVWGCEDPESGPTRMGGDESLAASGTHVATCTDRAGNEATRSFDVLIDGAAPAIGGIALTTADGRPYTSGDWTSQAVTLAWTCTDGTGGSGATAATDSAVAMSTDVLRAVCTDIAGNVVQGEPFQANIDTTAPVLAGVPANQSATTSGDTALVSWTAPTATDGQDATPDVVCAPTSGTAFPVGTTTVTCTATDHVGNVDIETFTVTVTREATAPDVGMVHRAPIDAPPVVNVAKRNAIVPVRVSLTGIGSPLVDDVDTLALGAPTRVTCPRNARTDAVETYTSRWAQPTNQFFWDQNKRNWYAKLDTRTLTQRNACYRVPVMYGGTVSGGVATGGEEIGFFLIRTP